MEEAEESVLQTPTFANHAKSNTHASSSFANKPAGPQLWAVCLTVVGLYYIWTRLLGRSLPSFLQWNSGGRRVGSSSKAYSASEVQSVRERQQQRLELANRAREMVAQAKERNMKDRNSGNSNTQQSNQRLQHKEEERNVEEKKRKQRQLYLRKKAEQEKEEEIRRKDEELGPGWRYREDPNAAANLIDRMNPQAGSDGGGYKPKTVCTKRGG